MKNSILIIGLSLVLTNTLIGLLLSNYSTFNFLFADISLLLSTVVLYYLLYSSISDGFKIGLGLFVVLIGLGKFICAVFSPQYFENNLALIIFICFVFIELAAIVVAHKMSKNH